MNDDDVPPPPGERLKTRKRLNEKTDDVSDGRVTTSDLYVAFALLVAGVAALYFVLPVLADPGNWPQPLHDAVQHLKPVSDNVGAG